MGNVNTKEVFMVCMQVQQHLEGPIGMALYEWQDGQIGMACVHGGTHIVIASHAYAVTDVLSEPLHHGFLHHCDLFSAQSGIF